MTTFNELPFHPVIGAWFHDRFGEPTDVQWQAWRGGDSPDGHLLIAAPTGSGKTLAALLPCLDAIVKEKERSEAVQPGVRVLYITPLKALNNDVHHHVVQFVEEMGQWAAEQGIVWPGVSAGVRTGDTPQNVRAAMLRRPPDVLVTTPESLYLMLTSAKARHTLATVRHVIVDEIHSLAGDSRGVHLSVTLERLAALCESPIRRIGVSATQKPLQRVAQYLGGWEPRQLNPDSDVRAAETTFGDTVYAPRPVRIVESPMHKEFELTVTMPERTMITADKEALWTPLVEKIAGLLEDARSTIIFVNNRRLCERLTQRLNDHFGYELARSHHGSVSREMRLQVERELKEGTLRCLVATASLELGIDVGHIDRVVQIDSPQSAAAGIQRIGRAGHDVGDVSRGTIIVRSRGLLAECAMLARRIGLREIEDIEIPAGTLDVLCQHIVAMASLEEWTEERLADVLARSDAYRGLARERLESALTVLSGYFPFVRPLIEWDRATGRVRGGKGAGMAAIMGAGTIPQSSAYRVHHAESRVHLGELDEEYIHESRVGDVFRLGTSSWKIQSIQSDKVYVTEVANAFSEIPFWRAEAPGRSYAASLELGKFHEQLDGMLLQQGKDAAAAWLVRDYAMDEPAAEQLADLFLAQRSASVVPSHRKLVAEHYADELGQHHVVIHSLFGRRLNRTWLLVLERSLPLLRKHLVHTTATDNGIELILSEWNPRWLGQLFAVAPDEAETLLLEAVPGSPLLGMTFRRLAETALLLPRSFARMPTWKKRLRSEALLKEALPYQERFPFIPEAVKLSIEEHLDLPHLQQLLAGVRSGEVEVHTRDSHAPSPFAMQLASDFVNVQMYESDALGKELSMQLLTISRELADQVFGRESLANIAESAEAWKAEQAPPLDTEEEIVRLLKRLGDMTTDEMREYAPNPEALEAMLTSLRSRNRAARMPIAGQERWIAADEAELYERFAEDELAADWILRRHIDRLTSFTAAQLAEAYGMDIGEADRHIRLWSERGAVEPSPFAGETERGTVWTSSKALSSIIRYSAGKLRERGEAVDTSRYLSELLARQYVAADSKLSGADGLKEAISRLQGLFLPFSLWESAVFPARLADYRKEWLDMLCASGEVMWIGRKEPGEQEGKLAFFLTESKELLTSAVKRGAPESHPELYELLRRRGASFLTAISRELGLVPSEATSQLMDLVWEGRVANDQFAPLRLHGAGKSRPARKTDRFQSGLGRWYALETMAEPEENKERAAIGWVHQLLETYGIVTKEITSLQPEYSWENVQSVLKQLEQRGLLTRGFWIQGIPHLQYSNEANLEALRAPALIPRQGEPEWVLLAASDPANPFGFVVPWPSSDSVSFARKPGNDLALLNGRWALWIENNGRRFHTAERWSDELLDPAILKPLFRLLLLRTGGKKIVVSKWNGADIAESPAKETLVRLGAERDGGNLVIWPSVI